MPEDITAEKVYRMFGEVKDEIHKASLTCQKTQTKCHDVINRLDTDFQLHASNPQIHCTEEKKNEYRPKNGLIKTFWLSVFSLFSP